MKAKLLISLVHSIGLLTLICVVALRGFSYFKNQPWFSDFNAKALLNSYTEAEINHFATFAFDGGALRKWTSDINMSFVYSDAGDSLRYLPVKMCIDYLNGMMDEIKIDIVEKEDSNTRFYLVDSLPGFGKTLTGNKDLRIPYPVLSSGVIKVEYADHSDGEIHSRIHHEIANLLGFHHMHPVPVLKDSLPIQHKRESRDSGIKCQYNELDKAAIRIMYDAKVAIDPGITRSVFYEKIAQTRKYREQ